MAEMLLSEELSNAYVISYHFQTPLHMAIQYGSTSAVKTILRHPPDTAEQLGLDGRCALHIAVNSGMISSLKCLLENIHQEGLINHRDSDGNTALHLAAKQTKRQMSMLLARDKRANPCVLNNDGQTAWSAIEMLSETSDYDLFVWNELKKLEAKKCKKHYVPPPREASMQYEKNNQAANIFNASIQTYAVIAALITTVTFAATFTMPGGYDQQSGYAILRKEAAFKWYTEIQL
ncbi:hypothetical protein LUZ63_000607 [Rhynchospora breviuscula]|uniref:PGG domain-containing protein n=1 Tax=Rhynchospora breviuscula TaxID=2022672 RepID=A0A9Q0HX20_9POAL|nr:hypothetical protein LUZ63_000607 [Rhynchospora breviuscula]